MRYSSSPTNQYMNLNQEFLRWGALLCSQWHFRTQSQSLTENVPYLSSWSLFSWGFLSSFLNFGVTPSTWTHATVNSWDSRHLGKPPFTICSRGINSKLITNAQPPALTTPSIYCSLPPHLAHLGRNVIYFSRQSPITSRVSAGKARKLFQPVAVCFISCRENYQSKEVKEYNWILQSHTAPSKLRYLIFIFIFFWYVVLYTEL